MCPLFFNTPEYKRKQADIVHQNWQKGLYKSLVKKEKRYCLNSNCKNYFIVPPSDKQKYCSQNCWYFVRRDHKVKTSPPCSNCGKLIIQKGATKFCSIKCQFRFNYNQYIRRWKQGMETGNRGINAKTLSRHIRHYLLEKYGEKCSNCGWNQRHQITGKVPLEVDHIDGNSENNKEENLRLICPNCHSLTPCFRNLNKGNGRSWRLKYLKKIEPTCDIIARRETFICLT